MANNHRGTTEQRRKEIGARIKQAFDRSPRFRGAKQADIGKRFGVKGQAVSNWFNGTRLPGADHCIEIARVLNVSLDWLLLGRGDMMASIKGTEIVKIEHWPDPAKDVVRGMEMMYSEQENRGQK